MTSRETYDIPGNEQYHRDFVLKRPSTVGPWVVLGLGVTVVAFLGYLVYVNMLLPPPAVVAASEHVWRFDTGTVSALARPQPLAQRRQTTKTGLPQGRAPHALLGGRGPALSSE